ncbi:hypothetical protein PanWU01x14_246620, partial [Parasponia andersonii]
LTRFHKGGSRSHSTSSLGNWQKHKCGIAWTRSS